MENGKLAADELWMTPVEVALMLRRSRTTLERWRKQGKGPEHRTFNGRHLYARTTVRAFLGLEDHRDKAA